MKKKIALSLVCISSLYASDVTMETITVVDEKPTSVTVKNVSSEEVKSADLAEALSKNVPSVSLVRRSGIANDIILRGQKRDNINVTIDGTKVCGACPNRMDPPTSHVVTQVVENVEVNEGPFDVEEFGSLSGSVKVETKKPAQELQGEVGVNLGSFGYQKTLATVSGGNDKVKALVTISKEKGEQYKDGDGNTLAEQLANYVTGTAANIYEYSNLYTTMDAFEKLSFMGKVFVEVTDNQELRFGVTLNRSDDVLYPSSKMDAIKDDSNIYNLEYTFKNLSEYSKKLDIQLYKSDVEHPMSTQYRNAGVPNYSTNALTTDMMGLKIKNNFDIWDRSITYGVDLSRRNWDGEYTKTVTASGVTSFVNYSINDVDTDNLGFFLKCERDLGQYQIEWGARFDHTKIDSASTQHDNDYDALNANIFLTYNYDSTTKYFVGFGKSSRVPDARELYNQDKTGAFVGNADLDQTKNYEIDLGFEKKFENGKFKVNTFYSELKDYIYYADIATNPKFVNIDAHIYGAEVSAMYALRDDLYFNVGAAYKKGKKDTQPTGQTDTDLADISPLKVNASMTYEYDNDGDVELSFMGADSWTSIDSDNGEQELGAYGIFNLKTTRRFGKGFEVTAGVDNIFDRTYAITNTYKDLTLVTTGNTMLINEPGRYFYVNFKYTF